MAPEPARGGDLPADLLGALAHRVGNSLAVITGYSELLRTRSDERTRLEAADRIATAADDLRRVADDLVTLLVLELGVLPSAREPIPLGEAVDWALTAAGSSRGCLLALEPTGDDPLVQGDPDALGRLVRNALGGTCLRSAPGATVRVAVREADGAGELRVRSDGWLVGEAELAAALERIDPSQDASGSGERPSGLDLYAARRLAEAYGGSLAASAGPPDGLALVVRLPLAGG